MIQDYYTKRAKDYDRQKARTWDSVQGFFSTILDYLLISLCDCEKCRILDIGAGNGRTVFQLLIKNTSEIVGLDLSFEMLRSFISKNLDSRLSLILGNGINLPFKESSFDALVCISMFHYFKSPRDALQGFTRVMKQNGTLVFGDLTLHEGDESKYLDRLERTISPVHVQYHRPSELNALFSDHGIYVEDITTIPYRKTFIALLDDKAAYFDVPSTALYGIVKSATNHQRSIYRLRDDSMTLYYTLVRGYHT